MATSQVVLDMHGAPNDNVNGATVTEINMLMVSMGLDRVFPEMQRISAIVDEMRGEQKKTKLDIEELQKENINLKAKFQFMESRLLGVEQTQTKLQERAIEAQFRSMRNNLTFYGIPETDRNENTKQVVMDFLVLYLKIDPSVFQWRPEGLVWITRAHRFGKSGPKGGPRPIVAVFEDGMGTVLRNGKHLAGTKYIISKQLPPELTEEKRMVQPIFRNAKSQGKRPKVRRSRNNSHGG